MGWKIYFWFMIVFSVFAYLGQGFSRHWEIIDAMIFTLSAVGLYAFCWGKRIGTHVFWKVFFFVQIVWNGYYQFFIPMVPSAKEAIGSMPQSSAAILNIVLFLPLLIAIFLYAFKRSDIWQGNENPGGV